MGPLPYHYIPNGSVCPTSCVTLWAAGSVPEADERTLEAAGRASEAAWRASEAAWRALEAAGRVSEAAEKASKAAEKASETAGWPRSQLRTTDRVTLLFLFEERYSVIVIDL